MNEWRPVNEYTAEMCRVIVWLQWPSHNGRALEAEGMYQMAYRMALNEGAVWVDAANCIPIETTGRHVSHFMQPQSPEKSVSGHCCVQCGAFRGHTAWCTLRTGE